jgi:RHS repeat-associated protein
MPHNYYGYDGHGSVRYLTDPSGAIKDTYDYDAYGNLVASTGSDQNLFLFAGEQYDSDLGLYYNRARYLDVRVGRFWGMDTWEGGDPDPSSLHHYLYSPTKTLEGVDPSGHFETVDVVTALSVASTISGIASLGYHSYQAATATTKDERDAAVLAAYMDAAGITFSLVGLGGGSVGPRLAAAGYQEVAILAGQGISLAERAGTVAASLMFYASSTTVSGNARNTQNPNQVSVNKVQGDAKAQAFIQGLREQGVDVVGEQVYIKTPLGNRVADAIVRINGKLVSIEVKSGSGTRSALQFAKDMYINFHGAPTTGTAAQQEGILGQVVSNTRTYFIP